MEIFEICYLDSVMLPHMITANSCCLIIEAAGVFGNIEGFQMVLDGDLGLDSSCKIDLSLLSGSLHKAAAHMQTEIIGFLLDQGFDVNGQYSGQGELLQPLMHTVISEID